MYDTTSSADMSAFWIAYTLFVLPLCVLIIVAVWRVFTKAGQHGWAAIIPFYNIWVMLKVVGRPGWWLILYFIPLVNIVIHLIVAIDLAHSFDRSTTFGVVGLWLFAVIGLLMLAFGKSRYSGPAAAHHGPGTPVGGQAALT